MYSQKYNWIFKNVLNFFLFLFHSFILLCDEVHIGTNNKIIALNAKFFHKIVRYLLTIFYSLFLIKHNLQGAQSKLENLNYFGHEQNTNLNLAKFLDITSKLQISNVLRTKSIIYWIASATTHFQFHKIAQSFDFIHMYSSLTNEEK